MLKQQGVSVHDFILDSDGEPFALCNREGNKYVLIIVHSRSYFAAVYFASEYDCKAL
jgi:hypothetical protein